MSKKSKQIIGLIFLIVCITVGVLFETQEKPQNLSQVDHEVSYFDIASIPEYTDKIYITINDNMPYFKESEYTKEPFEKYSELDNLGRCRSRLCKCLLGDNA